MWVSAPPSISTLLGGVVCHRLCCGAGSSGIAPFDARHKMRLGRWGFPSRPAWGSAFRKVACGPPVPDVFSSVQGYHPAHKNPPSCPGGPSLLSLPEVWIEARRLLAVSLVGRVHSLMSMAVARPFCRIVLYSQRLQVRQKTYAVDFVTGSRPPSKCATLFRSRAGSSVTCRSRRRLTRGPHQRVSKRK